MSIPIRIRGVDYPSAKQAAEKLGVSPNAVYNALRRGTIDNVGSGSIVKDPEPITIRGIKYSSIKQAAEKLNVHINAIYNARRAGSLDRVGLGRYVQPVKIRGKLYKSARYAAKCLRIHVNVIYNALERGTIDNVGLGPGKSERNCKKLDLGRVSFPSMAEASRFIGRSNSYVSKMIKKGQRDKVISEILTEWEKRNAPETMIKDQEK